MNYTYHPAIRESLLRSEVVNTRCEVSIPLYKLRKELEKHRVVSLCLCSKGRAGIYKRGKRKTLWQ